MVTTQSPSTVSFRDEKTNKTYKTASALKTAITKRNKKANLKIGGEATVEFKEMAAQVAAPQPAVLDSIETVEINQECVVFIPGINKMQVLKDWCEENCIKPFKTMGRSGMQWVFTCKEDADAFHKAWNIRSAKKVNIKEDDE